MKPNYDCIRKVLFVLEDVMDLNEYFDPQPMMIDDIVKIPAISNNYSEKDIAYSIYMLADAGFLIMESTKITTETFVHGAFSKPACVLRITYSGHEFLQKIKNETIWSDVKEKLKPLGIMTIDLLFKIASELIANRLNG